MALVVVKGCMHVHTDDSKCPPPPFRNLAPDTSPPDPECEGMEIEMCGSNLDQLSCLEISDISNGSIRIPCK